MYIDNRGIHFEENDNKEKVSYNMGFNDGYKEALKVMQLHLDDLSKRIEINEK